MVDRDLQNMVLDRKAKLIIMPKKKKKKTLNGAGSSGKGIGLCGSPMRSKI
jgi:hypothetical protein